MKRNVLNSPHLSELKKRRRRAVLIKILLSISAFVAIFATLAYISRIPVFNITGVEIINEGTIDNEVVKIDVEKGIAGYYLWFFPKTNILFYPKNSIKKELSEKFKRLKDATFSVNKDKILEVGLTEREAKYVWCGEKIPETEMELKENQCSFIDDAGFVFDVAPYFSGNVYFKFFGTLSGDSFSPNIFNKIITLKENLQNMGVKPTSLYIKNDGDIEIYLTSNSLPPNSPKIILQKDFELEKLSQNLQAALDTEPLKSEFKNKYASLLYIDLRFGNKVYYKFK